MTRTRNQFLVDFSLAFSSLSFLLLRTHVWNRDLPATFQHSDTSSAATLSVETLCFK